MAEPVGRVTAPGTAILASPNPAIAAQLRAEAANLGPWLIEMRRSFHAHPELGWREIATTARIVSELESIGYKVTAGREFLGDVERLGLDGPQIDGEGESGCVAVFDTGRAGPTVCVRVDIDALPIREATSNHRPAVQGWRSGEDDVMHACGHDGHIAIGLGVARLLRPLLPSGKGRLKILFQPAEEGGRGAQAVADAGWMDDVDLFLAIHLGLGVPSGTVALGVEGFLATRKYAVDLTGRSAHAGKAPEQGRNALLAACQMVLGLHGLAQSGSAGVRVNVGVLAAGTAVNIVPDRARFQFEIRALETSPLADLEHRCRRMIEATAEAHEVKARFELRGAAESWRNPTEIVDWAETVNNAAGAFPTALRAHDFGASEDAT